MALGDIPLSSLFGGRESGQQHIMGHPGWSSKVALTFCSASQVSNATKREAERVLILLINKLVGQGVRFDILGTWLAVEKKVGPCK